MTKNFSLHEKYGVSLFVSVTVIRSDFLRIRSFVADFDSDTIHLLFVFNRFFHSFFIKAYFQNKKKSMCRERARTFITINVREHSRTSRTSD